MYITFSPNVNVFDIKTKKHEDLADPQDGAEVGGGARPWSQTERLREAPGGRAAASGVRLGHAAEVKAHCTPRTSARQRVLESAAGLMEEEGQQP